jgi:ubiquitin C-terminal hydrolase
MSLTKFNANSMLYPFGLRNIGYTCYFNSVLQAMLSCTSFIDELMDNDDEKKYDAYTITSTFVKLIKLAYIESEALSSESKHELREMGPLIWKIMLTTLAPDNSNIKQFARSQQCASEGYTYLLDALDPFSEIQNLFMHRYKTRLFCVDCEQWVSTTEHINNMFEVQADLKTEQLEKFKLADEPDDKKFNMNEFLLGQDGYVDKDFICPKCKNRGEKYKRTTLTMAPEVLVVLAKKYESNHNVSHKINIMTEFPPFMEFYGYNNSGNYLARYEAVAQIEHVGGLNGGHYWSVCKRRDGWYCLNDTGVSPAEFKPTPNTYMCFYHLV